MARNHMTQLAVNVLMLFLVSTHSPGLNLLVHSTEWHLQGSEVFLKDKLHSLVNLLKRHTAQVNHALWNILCGFSQTWIQENC